MDIKNRSVFLFGKINKHSSKKIIRRFLKLASKNKEPIILFINSPGGDSGEAFDIIHTITLLGVPLITIGHLMIASAATMLFAVGQVRLVTPATSLIHHNMKSAFTITRARRSSKEIRALAKSFTQKADTLDDLFTQFLILATRDSKLSPNQLRKMIADANGEDIRFSDKEMKRRRLAHDILPDMQCLPTYIEKYLNKK